VRAGQTADQVADQVAARLGHHPEGALVQAATVSIDETFLIDSPVDAAWRLLTDPAVVVRCMPGAEIIEERGDGTLLGALRVKLGPTVVAFKGEVTPTFDDDAHLGTLVARGADGQGRTRARATTRFTVTPGDDRGTSVSLDGEIEVSGPLAAFARSGGVHLTRRMVAEFSTNLAAFIETNAPRTAGPHPVAALDAPVPSSAPVGAGTLVAAGIGGILRTWFARLRALAARAPRGREKA
jgi:carbon monoxide dehydrogenase subunit G